MNIPTPCQLKSAEVRTPFPLCAERTFDGFDPETNPILKGFTAAGSSAEKKYKDGFCTVLRFFCDWFDSFVAVLCTRIRLDWLGCDGWL